MKCFFFIIFYCINSNHNSYLGHETIVFPLIVFRHNENEMQVTTFLTVMAVKERQLTEIIIMRVDAKFSCVVSWIMLKLLCHIFTFFYMHKKKVLDSQKFSTSGFRWIYMFWDVLNTIWPFLKNVCLSKILWTLYLKNQRAKIDESL